MLGYNASRTQCSLYCIGGLTVRHMRITIAQIKVKPEKGNPEHNHGLLQEILGEIAPHAPDIVVTPEAFLDGYIATLESVSKEQMPNYAIDPERSESSRYASQWSCEHGSWLIYGCSRRVAQGVANSVLIYNREGSLAGVYDKVHLQLHDEKFVAGNALPVFESDFGFFGVMICADRRWPETARTLALKGARIIFNPTYGMHDERNIAMMRTRSYENESFIAFTHPSQSLVTGPDGDILQNNECDNDHFAITEVDLSIADMARKEGLAHLHGRRPDVYEL